MFSIFVSDLYLYLKCFVYLFPIVFSMLLVGMKIVTVEQMIKENNSQIANLTNYSNQIIVVLINYSFNKCSVNSNVIELCVLILY